MNRQVRPNLTNPWHFLAFGFGSGLSPKAPGTVGTLVAIPLYIPLQQLGLAAYLWVVVLAFVFGVYLCQRSSDALGVHDHGGIVWDEWVGYWVTMIAAPPGWWWLGIGFVLFRFFDIVKPWPISWADRRISGGLGIMLDDLLAGMAALACVQGLAWLLPGLTVAF